MRTNNGKPNFSEKEFITLLITKLAENKITKIDTVKLRYELAKYYSSDEFACLFEDISLKEQIEGNMVEIDNALLFAQFIGLISNPIQGTNTRMIFGGEMYDLISSSAEYSDKMEKLVSELINSLEKSNSLSKRIQYGQKMISRKESLEKELEDVNKQIDFHQRECDHVNVCLGWSGSYQCRDTSICKCLFCGEYDPESKYNHLDATNYMSELYDHGQYESLRRDRLQALQNLAMNIISEKEDITIEQLIEIMNEMIKNEGKTLADISAELRGYIIGSNYSVEELRRIYTKTDISDNFYMDNRSNCDTGSSYKEEQGPVKKLVSNKK